VIFNTWIYGVFLLGVFVAYWLVPARARWVVLVGSGAYFYWYYYPSHLPFIVAVTAAVYGVGRLGNTRRPWLMLGVVAALGLLAYFKYQGFLAEIVGLLLRHPMRWGALPRPPLGISFFVFEYVHYLIEVGRGMPPATAREFALFILFFPTLICGPIKRFPAFRQQLVAGQRWDASRVHEGLERILVGLAKKILVADQVALWCTPVLAHPEQYTWGALWLGVYGYAVQIYFDFAGYSDIAIGSARLLGFDVPENFNYPYFQPNVARFWRSWHMSLTSWITDYVYIPLGGNRHGELRTTANRLIAMTLCGLWHGAAFHFAAWGLYHGVAINLYRAYTRLRVRWWPPRSETQWWQSALATLATFHVVCVGWVLFVCDLPRAWYVIGRLFGVTT